MCAQSLGSNSVLKFSMEVMRFLLECLPPHLAVVFIKLLSLYEPQFLHLVNKKSYSSLH